MYPSNQFNDFDYAPHQFRNPGLWKTLEELTDARDALRPLIAASFEAREGYVASLGTIVDNQANYPGLRPQLHRKQPDNTTTDGGIDLLANLDLRDRMRDNVDIGHSDVVDEDLVEHV